MENKNYIAAIDLGSKNVVVAVGSRAADGKVEIEEVVVGESVGVAGGEVRNVESAAGSIRKAVAEIEEKMGVKITEVYTGISGSHIRCAKHPYYVYVADREGEIHSEDVRKLNESMHDMQAPAGYKLMHIIPQNYIVNEDEEVLDPIGRYGKTLGSTFNLIIGDNTILTRLERAFQRADIKQAKMFINPLAMAEAVTFPDEKDLGVAVIDIGAGTTDVTVYQGGIVRNVSVIPLGADAVNKDIRSYGIMERYVEELKVMYGCAVSELVDSEKLVKTPGRTPNDYKDISFRNLASIIEARMLDIVDYVIEEIKDSGYEGRLGAGIVLTGGGANLKEIKTLFEDRTKLDVRIASPDILVAAASKEKAADPTLAVVVGILWQGMNSGIGTKVETRVDAGTAWQPPQPISEPLINGRTPVDTDSDAYSDRRKKEKKPKRVREYAADSGEMEDLEPAVKRGGIFGKLRKAITTAIDLDVLDDDDTRI